MVQGTTKDIAVANPPVFDKTDIGKLVNWEMTNGKKKSTTQWSILPRESGSPTLVTCNSDKLIVEAECWPTPADNKYTPFSGVFILYYKDFGLRAHFEYFDAQLKKYNR